MGTAFNVKATRLSQVPELITALYLAALPQLAFRPFAELIKHVEVPLHFELTHDARFLEEIVVDPSPAGSPRIVEIYLKVFSEAGRVVVPESLGVAESL